MTPYNFIFMPPANDHLHAWAARISSAVPEVKVTVCSNREHAMQVLPRAKGVFGNLDPELLASAQQLKWLACPAAGPDPSFYFPELVDSSVIVTNMRGIYSDHIGVHIMAFVLAFARGFHEYLPHQFAGRWGKNNGFAIPLSESTAVIIGAGGIGSEAIRHCAHFGMDVIAIDPRCSSTPPGAAELHSPETLDEHLGRADFVIIAAPQTPQTEGLIDLNRLRQMKPTTILINIGRGIIVKLDDLDQALREGIIGGAGLDVFETEPLPPNHPLWTAPNFLMTPHIAANGPHVSERRLGLLIDNCRRLANGDTLVNIVDKANWF